MSSDRCEERNASNTTTAQFFSSGETISGTSYFYAADNLGLGAATATGAAPFFQVGLMNYPSAVFNPLAHAGSIREMTNSSGVIQDQRAYDPYGRVTQLQGTLASDFQYAGYYEHARSGLNLTQYRAYSAKFGRWLSRDPLGEDASINLYAYVDNDPIEFVDVLGLFCHHNDDDCAQCLIDFQDCRSGCIRRYPPGGKRNDCIANCKADLYRCQQEHCK